MTITYWTNFSKRKNSTKRPSSGTQIDVNLKAGTSLEAPVFILSTSDAFNIVYVEAFGHYYFVSDVRRINNNITEVICSQDVLATYKTAIGNTTALITRSSSDFNQYLHDDRVSVSVMSTSTEVDADTMPFDDYGCFILSVVNDLASETGYVANYIVHPVLMAGIAKWLSGGGDYTAAGAAWNAIESFIITQFGDVFDCVRACKWIPVPYNTAKEYGTQDAIRIGKYYTDTIGILVDTTSLMSSGNISIDFSEHMPQDFRSAPPTASVDLYLPYYGIIGLDPVQCFKAALVINYFIDLCTGDCHVIGYTGGTNDDKILFSIHYDIGVDTPIAQVGRTGVAVTQALTNVAASIGSGNPLAAAATGIGLVSAFASNGVSQRGSLAGRAMSSKNKIQGFVTIMATTTPQDLAAVQGRPLMEVRQINTLSGYVECNNASVSISGPAEDRDAINSYLNSGFFYE